MTGDTSDATLRKAARVAYHAYGETVGWKNFRGDPMPVWDDLGESIQAAWHAAAKINYVSGYHLGYADGANSDTIRF